MTNLVQELDIQGCFRSVDSVPEGFGILILPAQNVGLMGKSHWNGNFMAQHPYSASSHPSI